SSNAGKERPDGNQDVAEETGSSPLLREVLDGRVNGAAKKKNEGVGVKRGRKPSDPLPRKHSTREAMIEILRNFNRRGQHTDSGNQNARHAHQRRDIGEALFHEQVNGSLSQGVSAQQGPDDVPDLGVPFAPAENRIDAFRKRAHAEREHAQGPPQQVRRSLGEIVRHDAAEEENRKQRGENRY